MKDNVQQKRVPALFYRQESGAEPVREWLKDLSKEEKKLIGEDIKTCELGWPIGMPVSRNMGDGLHEVRTNLPNNRMSRILFYIDKKSRMILLHGFIKKTPKTPEDDLKLARQRKAKHEELK
jgi:phage-related protein